MNNLNSLELIDLSFLDNETLEKAKLLIEHMIIHTTIDFDTRITFDEIKVRRKPKVIINSKVTINKK